MTFLTPFLIFTAFAISAEDIQIAQDAIQKATHEVLSEEQLCLLSQELADPLGGPSILVGLDNGKIGCQLMGAVSNGLWHAAASGPTSILGKKTWKKASLDAQYAAVEAWTDGVMLGFSSGGEPTQETDLSGKNIHVYRQHLRQVKDGDYTVVQSHDTFVYSKKTGALTDILSEEKMRYRTKFYQQGKTSKTIDERVISSALNSQTRAFTRCFESAFRQDFRIQNKIRLQWTVANERATQLAVMDADFGPLAKCYAKTLSQVHFTTPNTGKVVWLFGMKRSEVLPPLEEISE